MATDPSSATAPGGDRTVDSSAAPTDAPADDAAADSSDGSADDVAADSAGWPSTGTPVDLTDRDRVRTTIDLERDRRDGGAAWTATQYEVPVVGRGETAPEAAADYCRRIAERAERGE